MPFIIWNNSYSIGIESIDQEHQTLVAMMNDLHDAMQQNNLEEKDVLKDILDSLLSYTATHFNNEENYFDQFEYPDTDSHKKEHADFIKKVSRFKIRFDKGEEALSYEIMVFLKDWLLNHIKFSDKKYAQFFIDNGLEKAITDRLTS
ncbi:MAG: bacteriohemerythrin [bacterium]|nr:bacteriohemerythrin [bacterium]MCP4801085.1 bacteriohemerythrin [bacterium]